MHLISRAKEAKVCRLRIRNGTAEYPFRPALVTAIGPRAPCVRSRARLPRWKAQHDNSHIASTAFWLRLHMTRVFGVFFPSTPRPYACAAYAYQGLPASCFSL